MNDNTISSHSSDLAHASQETCHKHHYPLKRVCWTAIIAGAFVAFGLSFLLNLFGAVIGLSLFHLNDTGAIALALGGFLGFLIASIAAMATAGYTAGYLGRHFCPERNHGNLYGFLTWSLALLLAAIVATSTSSYITSQSNNMTRLAFVIPESNNRITDAVTNDNAANNSAAANQQNAAGQNANQDRKLTPTPRNLAWAASLMFILFFIGALSSCVGACYGMSCKRND